VLTRSELAGLITRSGLSAETLESGDAWLTVVPELAARIMGVGIDEENAFWVAPDISRSWKEGGNPGGQRTWLAPEGGPSGFFFSSVGVWTVPEEIDPASYVPVPAADGGRSYRADMEARAADGSRYSIAVTRSMSLEQRRSSWGSILLVRFRNELANRGSVRLDRRLGLWNLIQLPCDVEGIVFVAGGPSFRAYHGRLPTVNAGSSGRMAWMRVRGGSRFKAGMSPSDFGGTMGFVRRSRLGGSNEDALILTAMAWDPDPSGTYVDLHPESGPLASRNGDAAQVYGDAGTGDMAFCEVEAHAPAPLLGSGQSQSVDITISVAKPPREGLAACVSDLLGVEAPPAGALAGRGKQ